MLLAYARLPPYSWRNPDLAGNELLKCGLHHPPSNELQTEMNGGLGLPRIPYACQSALWHWRGLLASDFEYIVVCHTLESSHCHARLPRVHCQHLSISFDFMLKNLTSSQQRILEFYRSQISEHGRAPSYPEAGKILDLSPSVIHYHVKHLETLGYLVKSNRSRGVQLVGTETQTVPLLGLVAGGEPTTIFEECD